MFLFCCHIHFVPPFCFRQWHHGEPNHMFITFFLVRWGGGPVNRFRSIGIGAGVPASNGYKRIPSF